VAKWSPEECTKKCAGGEQKLTRGVLTHPNKGAKCLPLAAMRSCNNHPCPVNCKLSTWSGWSKCSADCGGGVQQRLREVKQAMKYGGNPCGETSESKACNGQACEADCDLSPWTKWSACSKDCDGGTKKRQKFIKKKPLGDGELVGSLWKLPLIHCKVLFHAGGLGDELRQHEIVSFRACERAQSWMACRFRQVLCDPAPFPCPFQFRQGFLFCFSPFMGFPLPSFLLWNRSELEVKSN